MIGSALPDFVLRGEMAALVRRFDWAATSLGPRETWAASLSATVDLALASPMPIVLLCGEAGVMIYNDAYSVLAGGRHPAVLGMPVLEGWPEVAEFNRRVLEVGLRGGTLTFRDQHLVLHRHGVPEDVWMDLNYSPIRDEGGRPIGVLAIVVETTQRIAAERQRREAEESLRLLNANLEQIVAERTQALRLAEEHLHQAQRMEAMGQLTGGIAHDFNNLLQALSACLTMIGRRVAEPAIRPMLEAGQQAVDRGAKLTQQLMTFARHQSLRPEAFDVRDRLVGMSGLIERALRADIVVRMAPPAGLWAVQADPTQFELALLNLVVNARDAIAGAGTLDIAAANWVGDGSGPDGLAGEFVRIAVCDSGTGMPPDVLARVFEPFFTTKAVGKGSGLGLSQVYGFCRQSGGTVTVDSTLGVGTTVAMILPRASQAPEVAAAAPTEQRRTTRGARLLVVEDDPLVASVVASSLTDLGYAVTLALSGEDAMARLLQGQPVDLLFSDMVMPGAVSGARLAREAAQLRPGLPVVLATGYSEEVGQLPDLRVLPKPYRIEELASAIEQELARAPSEDQPPADHPPVLV
jgi:PAS domain S-box-containing protein